MGEEQLQRVTVKHLMTCKTMGHRDIVDMSSRLYCWKDVIKGRYHKCFFNFLQHSHERCWMWSLSFPKSKRLRQSSWRTVEVSTQIGTGNLRRDCILLVKVSIQITTVLLILFLFSWHTDSKGPLLPSRWGKQSAFAKLFFDLVCVNTNDIRGTDWQPTSTKYF